MPDINRIKEKALVLLAKAMGSIGHSLEETRTSESLVRLLKSMPDMAKQYPKRILKMEEPIVRRLENDSAYIKIRADHPDPKIAALGSAIDNMLAHPLVRRFQRNKLHVFIAPDSSVPESIKGHWLGSLARLQEVAAHSPGVVSLKTILIPAEHFNSASVAELKTMTGHEIGHQLRCDAHIRRGLERSNRRDQRSERFADAAGVFLSGEPEAFKDGLQKILDSQKKRMAALPDENFFVRRAKRAFAKFTHDTQSREYPSLKDRFEMTDTIASMMKTPEGYSQVERLLSDTLEAERRRLFPHHYSSRER